MLLQTIRIKKRLQENVKLTNFKNFQYTSIYTVLIKNKLNIKKTTNFKSLTLCMMKKTD